MKLILRNVLKIICLSLQNTNARITKLFLHSLGLSSHSPFIVTTSACIASVGRHDLVCRYIASSLKCSSPIKHTKRPLQVSVPILPRP